MACNLMLPHEDNIINKFSIMFVSFISRFKIVKV